MDGLLVELLKDSPWIALSLYLLHRLFSRENAVLSAYREGAESQSSLSASIESLENSLGTVQTTLRDIQLELRGMGGSR